MKRNNKNGRWGGRALVLATLLAVCVALVPGQASAAVSGKKITFSSSVSVQTCQLTVEKVDLTAGTMTLKLQAISRPKGLQGPKIQSSFIECGVFDGSGSLVIYDSFNGGATVNQTRRYTVPTAPAPFTLCGDALTTKRDSSVEFSPLTCA